MCLRYRYLRPPISVRAARYESHQSIGENPDAQELETRTRLLRATSSLRSRETEVVAALRTLITAIQAWGVEVREAYKNK
jgi:hypothetical protein